ncbi:5-dehydro-4-deoxy-D-glucuronate isomerase [Echinicola jeungdonensis]|uniref:4-deoxy-L-threo-5-hexosulose-uronate ketol-isomerase n=1 Tax=Echinicola jeungdonensis TaxID=709343 RepID=A0ABV5J9B2_9BACT|nr:5-dehydro-4-deoxy-D-glucuronate isomerase [Echinicola jeungdonensis]MDN3670491.1 5-dehydro-4-deoxy-D-glucuronate isomerase [Echinicola jeungdonensis]
MHTNIVTRHASHPEDVKGYDTQKLRDHFLLEDIFQKDQINGVYSTFDRLIVGGIYPVTKSLELETVDQLKSDYFLERREFGVINVGDSTLVTVDGTDHKLGRKEALYIGKGTKEVIFHPSAEGQAVLYFNSAPAHTDYPTKKVGLDDAEKVELGSLENSNHRVINKLLVNSVVDTCQLQMGMTELKPGSVWNTMPAHTHDRRMEAYFYFDLDDDAVVCHYMGQPDETRHIWMKKHQAVISPAWSIHAGSGTSNYTFIWGMAGENLDYGDMDKVAPVDMK